MITVLELVGGPLDGERVRVAYRDIEGMLRRPFLFSGKLDYMEFRYGVDPAGLLGSAKRRGLYRIPDDGGPVRGEYEGEFEDPDSTDGDLAVI